MQGGTVLRCFGPDIVWAATEMRNAQSKLHLHSK